MSPLRAITLSEVAIHDSFWSPRIDVNREFTLPIEYEQLKKTGRIDAWKLRWKKGQPNPPHPFWDSDLAKWLESVAYSLMTRPDKRLERRADQVIELIHRAQQADGYLNTHFIQVRLQERWTNLRDDHELYCAGHLMEAAVAYQQATGKTRFLEVLCRYADHIDKVFGPRKGQLKGYPGHEEIELALVKLFRATQEERYLDLARFFIDERGGSPHYFDQEARKRGDPRKVEYSYYQAHSPVREQKDAVGHAVRACYLYAGMADVAMETEDPSLMKACKMLWNSIELKRMYITGGIGSTHHGERFTEDYDLPNEEAYAETCASIALVFFAHRMLQAEKDSKYADVLERALYNGVITGVSLDGKGFFYGNPLAAHPSAKGILPHVLQPQRQPWFGCACCPPNIARLIASLGNYIYGRKGKELYLHLYVGSSVLQTFPGGPVRIRQTTQYPWKESVVVDIATETPQSFTLAFRLPGWCRNPKIRLNGKSVALNPITGKGYAKIHRRWKNGDRVKLFFPMPVERVESHPLVRHNAGRIALQRGPIVYCLEEEDNGKNLYDLRLARASRITASFKKDLLGGIVVLRAKARRRDLSTWKNDLYQVQSTKLIPARILAIPYAVRANRSVGEMIVWIQEDPGGKK